MNLEKFNKLKMDYDQTLIDLKQKEKMLTEEVRTIIKDILNEYEHELAIVCVGQVRYTYSIFYIELNISLKEDSNNSFWGHFQLMLKKVFLLNPRTWFATETISKAVVLNEIDECVEKVLRQEKNYELEDSFSKLSIKEKAKLLSKLHK